MDSRAEEVVERIRSANAGRDAERLTLKYQAMSHDLFAFLRGTCHLFAEDWPLESELDRAPSVWICGDLHLENFGTFKGDNRLEYFDINDFDETVLAPCTRAVARLVTSILVAGHRLLLPRRQAIELGNSFVASYAAALKEGKARWIERETASGMVKDLLKQLQFRKRKGLLRRKTMIKHGRRTIRADGVRATPAAIEERKKVKRAIASFAAEQTERRFFRVIDVARRVAGTGSLGVERYIVLIEGRGSPNKHYLVDLKKAQPSTWQTRLTTPQPLWTSEADRVVCVQKWLQAASPALLHSVDVDSSPFVMRELQPVEDRLSLDQGKGKLGRLEKVMSTMAEVTAWAHLRGASRRGAASVDSLVEFAERRHWRRALVQYAGHYAGQVRRDWRVFGQAFKDGAFA